MEPLLPLGDGGGEVAAGGERLLGHSRVRVVVEEDKERDSEAGPRGGGWKGFPSPRDWREVGVISGTSL